MEVFPNLQTILLGGTVLIHLGSSDWQLQLIGLFAFVNDHFEHHGWWSICQRFSNNNKPRLDDDELLTIYLYARFRGLHRIKQIWTYAHDHLRAFFPNLPAYQTFNNRLNRLAELFPLIIEHLQPHLFTGQPEVLRRLVDSYPVMLAEGKRSKYAKVAPGEAGWGYCCTKYTWYRGFKLHVVAISRPGSIPFIEIAGITPANVNDLKAFENVAYELSPCYVEADKSYFSGEVTLRLGQQGVVLRTPRKGKSNDVFKGADVRSWVVSSLRQPIESLFNWIHEKTGLQNAHRVRSYRGALVHIFGSLAVALLHWSVAFPNS